MRQNVKTGLRRVTETGVLLALLIVLQAATRSAGQYVTGTCVNAVLALAVLATHLLCVGCRGKGTAVFPHKGWEDLRLEK